MLFELFLLGISVGASFGPVNILVLRVGLNTNSTDRYYAATGAVLGDTTLLLLSLFAASLFSSLFSGDNTKVLATLSSLLLATVAIHSIFSKHRTTPYTQPKKIFLITYSITTLSPFGALLWLGVASYLATLSTDFDVYYFLMVIAGDICWFIAFLLLIGITKKHISPIYQKVIGYISNLIILGIAIKISISTYMSSSL